jgi:hypothetical protein
MRRIGGRAPRVWFDEWPDEPSETYGDAIAKIFLIRGQIEACSDPEFLKQRLVPSAKLRWIQESRCAGNDWHVVAAELALDSGLKYVFGKVDTTLASLLSNCDGGRTLQEVFEATSVRSDHRWRNCDRNTCRRCASWRVMRS